MQTFFKIWNESATHLVFPLIDKWVACGLEVVLAVLPSESLAGLRGAFLEPVLVVLDQQFAVRSTLS